MRQRVPLPPLGPRAAAVAGWFIVAATAIFLAVVFAASRIMP